jgi:hypothetical protein
MTRKGNATLPREASADSVEHGVVVVKFEFVYLCLGVLLICGKLRLFFKKI